MNPKASQGAVSILDACRDPELFGPWFRKRSTWRAWFTFLHVLFGLPLDIHQLTQFRQLTGRVDVPAGGFNEAWLICGRRAGKSMTLAVVAVFLAIFKNWKPYLSPGERGTIMVIAADRKQSRTIFRYITALLKVQMLSSLIGRETTDSIDLTNGVTIEIQTASFKSVRGYTIVAALLDEIAFWHSEDSANPDHEILNALKPAMATVPGAMLLCASSPYARRGAMWDAYRRHYGKADTPVLVWKAPTLIMNPTVPSAIIDAAMEADPASAKAEYYAEFRTDVEGFLTREVVEAAVMVGRYELPRIDGVLHRAFIDPSGGSSDSMTLSIAHMEGDPPVVDAMRERKPPFSPDAVAKEFAELVKSYGISVVRGDHYAGEWPREAMRRHGVEYRTSSKTKSEIYCELLPLLNSGRVELLDSQRMVAQFVALERSTSRGGKDSINHPPGGHDDLVNAVAGAIVYAAERVHQNPVGLSPVFVDGGGHLTQMTAPKQENGADKANAQRPPSHWTKAGQPQEQWRDFVVGPDSKRQWWGPV
jgi:hypothetical protein